MAADGNLYCVTYPDCALWRVDPATGAGERVAKLGEGELYGRGIATEGNDIVVCTTSPGGVYHYDISSGALTDITPGDRSAFIAVGIRDGKVWATYGPRVVEFTLTGEVLRRWQLAGSQIDTMGVLEDGSVAVWMRPTGHVHRLAPGAEEFEDLGTPAAEQEGRALILEADGRLGGLAGNGLLWSWSVAGFDTDDLNLSDLVGSTVVQHLCVMPNGMVATSGTDVHIHRRPRSGERAVRVPFAGTPMRLAYGDEALWAATYPRTEVYRIQPGTWRTERVGTIGNGQYRPYAMHYDEARNALVIATEPSSIPAGGAVTVVDLASREFTSWVAPLGGQAVIHATAGERTFVSGGLSDEPPLVGEIDLDTGEVAWTVAPLPHLRTIESTVLHEGLLYGVARGNEWFAIDVDSHQVVHTGWLSGTHSYGNVAVQQGRVVLPTHRSLVFELDVNKRDAQVLAEGGEESWRRPPQFGFDRRGTDAWGLSDLRLARWDLSGDHLPRCVGLERRTRGLVEPGPGIRGMGPVSDRLPDRPESQGASVQLWHRFSADPRRLPMTRASDQDRDVAAEAINAAYGEGRLTAWSADATMGRLLSRPIVVFPPSRGPSEQPLAQEPAPGEDAVSAHPHP